MKWERLRDFFSLPPPTSTGGNFLLNEESGKGDHSSFSQGFHFLSSGPSQKSFTISPFWEGPSQLLLCSPGHLQPGLVLIQTSILTKSFLLVHHQCRHFWELRMGSLQTLPEPFPAPPTAPRGLSSSECLDAFPHHLLGFHCKTKTASLTSSFFCLALLKCACQTDVEGHELDTDQGERNKYANKQLKGSHASGVC